MWNDQFIRMIGSNFLNAFGGKLQSLDGELNNNLQPRFGWKRLFFFPKSFHNVWCRVGYLPAPDWIEAAPWSQILDIKHVCNLKLVFSQLQTWWQRHVLCFFSLLLIFRCKTQRKPDVGCPPYLFYYWSICEISRLWNGHCGTVATNSRCLDWTSSLVCAFDDYTVKESSLWSPMFLKGLQTSQTSSVWPASVMLHGGSSTLIVIEDTCYSRSGFQQEGKQTQPELYARVPSGAA